MKTHNLIQGSKEWHAHRNDYDNASDLPAAASVSKYKTRDQLKHEYVTGLMQEFDAATQRRMADGHRFEALARKHVEVILGEELSPTIGTDGALSASFDGITLMGDIVWEHKTINDDIRACATADDLHEQYKLQMDQQLLISGADKAMFSATSWDNNGNLLEEKHLWYTTTPERKQAVIDIWAQFHRDLANYTPPVVAEKVVADAIESLPTLYIQAKGEITASNMKEYGQALAKNLAYARSIKFVTEQDFANAKESAKYLREQIVKNKQMKEAMLEQTVTVGEAVRMIDDWCEDMRKTALKLETDWDVQDKIKKATMITKAKEKFTGIIAALEAETAPIRILETTPDFANAIKGKRNYDSMQGAINDLLASAELHVNNLAKDLRAKLTWFKSLDCQFPIFADLQTLIYKQADDFKLAVNARIAEHEQKMAVHVAQVEAYAEQVKKVVAEKQADNVINEADFSKHIIGVDLAAGEDKTVIANIGKRPSVERPSLYNMVALIADMWGVEHETAKQWMIEALATETLEEAA